MDKKLVSVAMATYNGEKFLKEQIESILNQTYTNLEIVICDDCSNDNTYTILQEYAKKDQRIKLFRNETNLGYKRNFEKAITLSSGDYIALSDQDDIWDKNKIEILLEEIADYDLIHSDAQLIDENGNVLSENFSNYTNKHINPKDIIELAFSPSVTGCTCMFSRRLKEKAVPFCESIPHHDLWLSLVAFKSKGIKYLDKPLIKYRQHSANQIGALENNLLKKLIKLKNLKQIEDETFTFIENKLKTIKCLETKFYLTEEEKKHLYNIKNLIENIKDRNLKFIIYFYKTYSKFLLNMNFFKKHTFILSLYIKSCLINRYRRFNK